MVRQTSKLSYRRPLAVLTVGTLMMVKIETALVIFALLLAFLRPNLGSRWFKYLEQIFSRLAHRRTLAIVLSGTLALVLRVAILPVEPIPQPAIQDEFSYLLGADTFLHGRLTNPTHPMWVHFESFNIIQKPTYASIYPPVHALFLALGRLVFGHPFWGVWLSLGIMSAAICWMLQGWISPPLALLGAFLCVVRFCTFSFWANSYMVPAASALGGALTLGALPRIKQSPSVKNSLLLGLGLAILANTRPYEGLVFSIPIAISLLVWMFRKNSLPALTLLRRVIAPLGIVLLVLAIAMAYYNWRVTRSPFLMPHRVGEFTYASVPKFLWEKPRHIEFRHQVMRNYDRVEIMLYSGYQMHLGLLTMSGLKFVLFWLFYIGPILTVPFLAGLLTVPSGFSWRAISKDTRFLLTLCGTCFLGFGVETMFNNYYAAPMLGLILLLVAIALRRIYHWRWRKAGTGRIISWSIPIVVVLSFLARSVSDPLHFTPSGLTLARLWCAPWSSDYGRPKILAFLNSEPGQQLVIVRYAPVHNTMDEWVYNDADIDNSKIVWAREMDPKNDAELLKYFNDRKAWLLEADDNPPKLLSYETSRFTATSTSPPQASATVNAR